MPHEEAHEEARRPFLHTEPNKNSRLRVLLGGKKVSSAQVSLDTIPVRHDTKPDRILLRSFYYTKDKRIREHIFNRYHKRILSQARGYWVSNMPYAPLLELVDLEGAAAVGLLKAIDEFNPNLNDNFPGWVRFIVNGAIIDELRKVQDFPRIIASKRRMLRPRLVALAHKLRRYPNLEDIKEHLGDEYYQIALDPLVAANVFNQCSTSAKRNSPAGEQVSNYAEVALDDERDIDVNQMREDVHRIVCNLLTEPERSIIYQYYFMGMTIPDIAFALGISTTTVSEKKELALRKLKIALSPKEEPTIEHRWDWLMKHLEFKIDG